MFYRGRYRIVLLPLLLLLGSSSNNSSSFIIIIIVYDYIQDGQPREHPSISKSGTKFISFPDSPKWLWV